MRKIITDYVDDFIVLPIMKSNFIVVKIVKDIKMYR